MKFKKLFFQIYRNSIAILSISILFFMIALNAVNTCHLISDGSEMTFFTKDSIFLNMPEFIIFILFLSICGHHTPLRKLLARLDYDKIFFTRIRNLLLGVLLLLGLFWVLGAGLGSGSDQELILQAVEGFREKNYSMFFEDGYLARCRHQLGLTFIMLILSFPFGKHLETAFQLLNVFFLVLVYYELQKIGYHMGLKGSCRIAVILLGILFFPLTLYCTFVYGNLGSLALSLVALSTGMRFQKTVQKSQMILSAFCIMAAIFFKQNSLIFLIGLMIYAIYSLFLSENLKKLLIRSTYLLLLIIALLAAIWLPSAFFRKTTGEALNQGESSLSYLVMGLGESSLAPGWFNHYNYLSYLQSGYNTSVQTELSKTELLARINYFSNHKPDAVRHFLKKNASIWSNPNFQSFWIVQTRPLQHASGKWFTMIFSPTGEYTLAVYLNSLWFTVLTGAFYFFAFSPSRKQSFHDAGRLMDTSLLVLVFIGGFLFHIFWEAKAQYTISYVVLLFPYAVSGYNCLTGRIHKMVISLRSEKLAALAHGKRKFFLYLLIFSAGFAAIVLLQNKAHCLSEDTALYYQYLSESTLR